MTVDVHSHRETIASRPHRVGGGVFSPRQLADALPGAIRKLDPRHVARNPVMFVVLVGSAVATVAAIVEPTLFAWSIAAWLWFTVLFANLAESVAEGRGKAQAASLRKVKQTRQPVASPVRPPRNPYRPPSCAWAISSWWRPVGRFPGTAT